MQGTAQTLARVTKAPAAAMRPATSERLLLATVALLSTGVLLALSTNLAKVALLQGVPPLPYLTWSVAGAAAILTLVSWGRGHAPVINRRFVEYSFVAAFLSVAGANLILFHAVAHVGVSFVSLVISLPSLLTYVGALALRMESFCGWRAAGVVFALVGTALLVFTQWRTPGTDKLWLGATLLVPVLLAAGNIYRTRRWPPGARAESLAPGMMLAATLLLVVAARYLPGESLHLPTRGTPSLLLVGIQAVVFAAQMWFLLILQKAGGPVFMSLIGAVGAMVGVPFAMGLLAEPMLPALLPSSALIVAGIVSMVVGVKTCVPVRARGAPQ